MSHRLLLASLFTAAGFFLIPESADAGHCCCRSGYSIFNCAPAPTATTTIHRGATSYRSGPTTIYHFSPSSYYYRSYSPYGYYRPYGSGISISIGSGGYRGYSYGPSYRPYYGYSRFGYGPSFGYPTRYGIGRRSGFSIGIGTFGRRSTFYRRY